MSSEQNQEQRKRKIPKTYWKQDMTIVDVSVLREYYNRRYNPKAANPLFGNKKTTHSRSYDSNMTWEKYLESVKKSGVKVIDSSGIQDPQ